MKTGDLGVEEVAPPALRSGGILVRTRRSLVGEPAVEQHAVGVLRAVR